MRVVHTHVDKYNFIWKEILYSQFLSAVLAKKHYGNITFVGTPALVEQVKSIGLPYTSYIDDLVDIEDVTTWSIPKLKTYQNMKEPFLHIDNDTFLFDKIDFAKYGKSFLFSHPDMKMGHLGSNFSLDFSSLINSFYSLNNSYHRFYYDLNHTYLRLFLKLISEIEKPVLRNFNLGSIPNMNIVYIEDYETFSLVSKKALKHYYSNKETIDQEEYGPCYIEQLTLHQILRSESKQYRKYSSKYKHTIFKEVPFLQKDSHNNVPEVDKVQFPFRGKLVSNCSCCNTSYKSKVTIKDKSDISNFLDFKFNGFLHSTYLKWYDIFQAYTIHNLRKEVGDSQIKTIYNYFKERHPGFELPIKSGGEKLYEELTGFSFE